MIVNLSVNFGPLCVGLTTVCYRLWNNSTKAWCEWIYDDIVELGDGSYTADVDCSPEIHTQIQWSTGGESPKTAAESIGVAVAIPIIAAAVAGRCTGAGTDNETYYGLDGVTPRIAATVDEDGNRNAVNYPD